MANGHDISGSWLGHYEQDGSRHEISMTVEQRGQSFVGRMRDQDTVLSGSVSLEECAADAEADGDGDAAGDGEAGGERVETFGVLPEYSIVEGDVDGGAVAFDKRYQGAHDVSAWIDGAEVHVHIPEHVVRYAGQLDRDGACMRGRWTIDEGDDFEGASGGFELRRQPRP